MPYKDAEKRKGAVRDSMRKSREPLENVNPVVNPKSHPNMPDVVQAWFMETRGCLPSEHLLALTREQWETTNCLACGGFYLIGTRQCPRCDRKPLDERLRALAGATTAKGVKG